MDASPSPENSLTASVRALFERCGEGGFGVAVALSGGMDSVSLLDAALPLSSRWPVAACHVNHGISPRAAAWERFCGELCAARGVRLFVRRASPADGEPTEEWARQVRMQAFAGLPVRAVAAAHHADDQAETVLFRMLRGTGAHGMGAMRGRAPLPGAPEMLLLRPWLGVPRTDIAAYARRRRLRWVEDEDNRNTARRRNFLRRRVMPVLREYFPESGRTLASAASRFGAAAQLLGDLADMDARQAGDGEDGLDLSYFLAMGESAAARLQNVLHVRLSRRAARFSERGLAEASRQILSCRGSLRLRFSGFVIEVKGGKLRLGEAERIVRRTPRRRAAPRRFAEIGIEAEPVRESRAAPGECGPQFG